MPATTNGRLNGLNKPSRKVSKRTSSRTYRRVKADSKRAYSLLSISAALLAVSIFHLTSAIAFLTGDGWLIQSFLLAVAIDAGMVASEVNDMFSKGRLAKRWAAVYMLGATAASMALNAFEFGRHVERGYAWYIAIGFGLALPLAVFALCKQAGATLKGE